jgi:hypothetical protein
MDERSFSPGAIQIPESEYHTKIRKDFRVFLALVHKHLNLPEPTPLQLQMASFLQNGPQRIVMMAFRGIGKSHITAAFVAWKLLCDCELKILVVSASEDRSIQFATFVRQLINELPGLEYLRARRGQRDSVLAFDVGPAGASQSPSVKCAGITGQITGSRADLLVSDDVEIPKNSATQTMRDKVGELVKEYDAILKPGKDSRIVYLGTPQVEDSLYSKLPDRGYTVRIWPARYPDAKTLASYNGAMAPQLERMNLKVGQPTDPRRFTELDLITREGSYGKAGFSLQFMLNTSLSDAEKYPLKIKDLIVMPLDDEEGPLRVSWGPIKERMLETAHNVAMRGDHYYHPMAIGDIFGPWENTVMSIDPSGRGKDETSYAVGRLLNTRVFIPAAGGLPGGYDDDTLAELAAIAKKYKVRVIVIESNFGDGMFEKLFRPTLDRIHPNCGIEEVRHSTQKEKRMADTLEPLMGSHKLVIDPQVIEDDWNTIQKYEEDKRLQKSLFYQMTRLTRDRGSLGHDDRLDALAMLVAHFTASMASDEDKNIDAERQRRLEEELKGFMNSASMITGGASNSPKTASWISKVVQ